MSTSTKRVLAGARTWTVAACLLGLAQSASANLIGSDFNGNLYSVDTGSGALTLIGNTGIGSLSALEYAPDGTLYGFNVGSTASLYSIDPGNANATPLGLISADFEGGLAISSIGDAWGTNIGTAANAQLFSVDLLGGTNTNLGVIGNGNHDINGLVWRSDGMLVGVDRVTSSLLEIDPNNLASVSVLALTLQSGSNIGGLTTTDYATGYLAVGTELYTVDLFSGAQALVGTTSLPTAAIELSSLALRPAVGVPEPASLALVLVGGLGFAAARRRANA